VLSKSNYSLIVPIYYYAGHLSSVTFRVQARLPMPDNVCVGATKHYNVDPNPIPGSTYTWKIGWQRSVLTTNAMWYNLEHGSDYLLTVQEHSADGCDGPVKIGAGVCASSARCTGVTWLTNCNELQHLRLPAWPELYSGATRNNKSYYCNTPGTFTVTQTLNGLPVRPAQA